MLSEGQNAKPSYREILAFLSGILADGKVQPAEVASLAWWLSAHDVGPDSEWPLKTLAGRVAGALADKRLDASELDELHDLFCSIVPFPNQNLVRDVRSLFPLTCPEPEIRFKSSVFVLTGRFLSGTTEHCSRVIREMGGYCAGSVTERTNYLVIGHLCASEWRRSSEGRSIRSATELLSSGVPVMVISEECLARQLKPPDVSADDLPF